MGRRRLLLLLGVVGLAALLAAARPAWVTALLGGEGTPAVGRPADLDADEAELAALAQAEAGRLRPIPGLSGVRAGAGAVTGRVARWVAGEGEVALEGVELSLAAAADGGARRAEGVSGPDGRFTVVPVPAGAGWVLRARKAPHRDLVVGGISVADGKAVDVGTLVFGAPTTLTGTVLDGTGRPLSGAVVAVERDRVQAGRADLFALLRDLADGAAPIVTGRSGADGAFALSGLPPGRYAVRVTLHGYAGAFVAGVVVTADGDAAGVRVVLEPGAGFAGRVTDEAGHPVDGAAVVALPLRTERLSAFERHEARTDADGRYRLDTLADETTYFVEAVAKGHASFGRMVTTKKVGELDFTLPAAGRVVGRVTDAATGSGVAGAEVLLLTGLMGAGTAPASTVADASGAYTFAHALPGPLLLLDVRAPGHARGTVGHDPAAPKVVRAGETLVLDVALTPGGVVRGTVRGEDGRPIPHASVAAWLPRSPFDGEVAALTDASGGYRLAGLRPERWTLTVTAPGWASPVEDGEVTVQVTAEAPESVRDFVLRAGGVVLGRVTTPDGAAAPGVRVTVTPRDARGRGGLVRDLVAVTDRAGAYRVVGAPAALDLVVEAAGPTGVTTRSEPFRVPGGGERVVDLVLRPGARIRGRVEDAAGRAVAGARVRFGHVEPEDLGRLDNSFRADDHLGPRTFATGPDGAFTCDDAPAGPVLLRVDADGFSPWFRRDLVVPTEGDLGGVVATLQGARSVAGRVLASDTGRPVPGAWVFAVARTPAGEAADGGRVDPLVTLETGPDGAYVLSGLPPGPVDVAVSVCLGYQNAWQDPASARKEGVAAGSTGVDFRLVPLRPAGDTPPR